MANDHMAIRKLHICTTRSQSGIADYACDFQRLVLEAEGYALTDPRDLPFEQAREGNIEFHVQLGAFQHAERIAVSRLLAQGYRTIDATIHDPPFATFPYFPFRSALVNRLSRGFDWYLNSFGLQRRFLERLRRIFVLSEHGRDAVLRIAPNANVVTIPHIVDRERVWPSGTSLGDGLIYFGFIGPNKGLDHTLEVHRILRQLRPDTQLHVVGRASGGRAEQYLNGLKLRYVDGVTYHGYIADDALDALFRSAAHVVLPYAPYTYIMPTSGSVIHALRRARVVWTTPANAMAEMIHDNENGFMLSLDAIQDARRIAEVMDDQSLIRRISDAARERALAMADFPYRQYVTATPSA